VLAAEGAAMWYTLRRASLRLVCLLAAGCAPSSPKPADEVAPAMMDVKEAGVREVVGVERVGGDMEAKVERTGDAWAFGRMLIDTPLPEGYPAPTPPGAIELKGYPSVRRAEVSSVLNPDVGMNMTFFPLFWHIKNREIAMTSPVEMDYEGMERSSGARPTRWTMSFLYRTSDLGPTGEAGMVEVVDRAPMTVLSLGGRGDYSISRVDASLMRLYAWLDEHPEWEQSGEPRALYYNGPERAKKDKWYEVQVPVKRR
jgi:hypothetical protein